MVINQIMDTTQLDNNLTSVANSIREITGNNELLEFPNEFVNNIENMYKMNDWLNSNKPVGEIIYNGTTVPDYFLYGRKSITSIKLPNATTIKSSAFCNCTNLSNFYGPLVQSIGSQSFNSTKIQYIILPSLITTNNGTYIFSGNTVLTALDIGNSNSTTAIKLGVHTLSSCTNLAILIIRPNAVSDIDVSYTLPSRWKGGIGGTLYVPQNMITNYQNNTKWATILDYENNQILPIEESYYETHYADGTLIPTATE